MAARADNIPYVVKQLLALDVSPASINALAQAFDACTALDADAGAPPAPEPAPAGYIRTGS